MKKHLNTLFVTTDGTYLHQDGAAVEVRRAGERLIRLPLLNLDGIACFGWNITVSAALMSACVRNNVALSFHTPNGQFLAAVNGFTSGNIQLRRAQYRVADNLLESVKIARNCIGAKIANARVVVQRALRDYKAIAVEQCELLEKAVDKLGRYATLAVQTVDMEGLRGIEGEAAAIYFGIFDALLRNEGFQMKGRSRRPPTDPVNALLSFVYTLLMHDCRSALESNGLDAQCGFLHRDRPGRPSLALDLMEEFRPFLGDRLVLTLLNRRQISRKDFYSEATGGVFLKEESRKKVITAWQERKQETLTHPFIEEKCTIGALPYVQALLLARHLRGDIDAYPAFLWR